MTPDQIDALLELKKLLDEGIINDSEFADQKKIVLNTDHQYTSVPKERNTMAHEADAGNKDSELSDFSTNELFLWILAGVVSLAFIIIMICISVGGHNSDSSYDGSYETEVPEVEDINQDNTLNEYVQTEAVEEYVEEDYDYGNGYRTESYDYGNDANSWY